MTSAANGFGSIGGRKPGPATTRARVGSPAAHAVKPSRSNAAPSRARTPASIFASCGLTSTPPGAASIRTSRPATTRCRPPPPERGAVHPEDVEARGREREVVGLRQRDEHARTAQRRRRPKAVAAGAERPTLRSASSLALDEHRRRARRDAEAAEAGHELRLGRELVLGRPLHLVGLYCRPRRPGSLHVFVSASR